MKKWIRSLGLSGLAAAALGLAWSGAAVAQGADKFQDILSKGVVRIGVPVDAPPFGSVNQQRQPEGFDIELAEMVAKALGAKLEMTQVTGANRIPYLLSDRVDIIMCTGRNQPIRRSCAIPRASLRSVFTIMAESAAFTWRVSSSTAS